MRARLIFFAGILLAACSGDSTGSSAPAAVAAVSGSGQAATVGLLATNPLVVRVTNAGGKGVQGVTVSWAVTSGGGSLTAASTVTGADGLAQVQWTLGTRAEAQTVSATVQGLPPAVFTITPGAGLFERIFIVPDSAELTAVNQSVVLRESYVDAYGNAVEQPAAVVWTSLDESVAELDLTPARELLAVATGTGRARIVARTRNVANNRNVADTAIIWVRQQPASITVTLRGGGSVTEGDTTRAMAEVRDVAGHPILNPPLTWSTTDPAGATIDATGKITALRGGTLDVVATVGSVTGAATLSIHGLFRVVSLDAGGHHSCALTAAGQAYCWGWNQSGQLGVPASAGTPADSWSAVPVAVQTGARFTTISASARPDPQPAASARGHSCGIAEGALLCWGENGQGQVGIPGAGAAHVPAQVAGGGTWATVSTGGRHTCGITTGGQTYCWGLDREGQVGAPTTELCAVEGGTGPNQACARTPRRVAEGLDFTRISAGTAHTCALTAGGQAYCWGRNTSGQLGNGTRVPADEPVAVLGGHTFATISAGGAHTCARTTAGAGYCWGDNGSFQLGNDTSTLATSPVAAGGSHSQAGWAYNCGLLGNGEAYCSGANDQGQRGHAPSGPSSWSTGVSGGFTFASLSTGGVHTCAVRAADGVAMCWGDNEGGKLGAGEGPDRGLPRPVRAP